MLSADGWDSVAETVTASDFYRPDHRLIFRQISQLAEALEPVDVIFLYRVIELTGEIADMAERVGRRLELLLSH